MTERSTESISPRDVLTLAVCAGLIAASGELALLAIRKFALHEILRLGSNVIWMAPLNDALLFALFGVALVIFVVAIKRDATLRLAVFLLACTAGLAPVFMLPVNSRVVRLAAAAAVIVVAYFALERIVRRAGARRVAVFACAFAATYAIALAIPRIHPAAQLLLAIGLGVRLAQVVDVSPRMMTGARRVFAALLLVFVLAGVGLGGWRAVREGQALAALPAAPAGARNVLLIIWDTVRSSSLSLYGYARSTTPNLDKLAASGVTFDWAFATAPWTLTSHASMFTGRFPYDLSADVRTPLDNAQPTVAERLSADGFVTTGFVANGFYGNAENGLARGFLHYQDFVISPGEILLASTFGRALASNARIRKVVRYYDVVARRNADDISASFLRWVDRRPDRPFFAFLNYFDAHLPYLPPEPWRSRFGPQGAAELWRLDHGMPRTAALFGRTGMSKQHKRELLDAYDGAIAYMDDRLGMLLDSLERRGLLRNTVVIVASDHGEHFGERGLFGHARSLYTQETRVPLVISAPDSGARGVRVTTPVGLRDLASTVLDVAHSQRAGSMPGVSLSRFWRSGQPATAAPDTVLSQYAQFGLSSMVVGRYQLIRGRSDVVRLFDLVADPAEANDLAGTAEGAGLIASIGGTYRAALAAKPLHPADNLGPRR